MVALRSFVFLIVRVDIIAGTEQPHPSIIETKLRPPSPNLFKSLSVMNAMRDIYPLASSADINPNRIIICGVNPTILITPETIPSTIKDDSHFALTSASRFDKADFSKGVKRSFIRFVSNPPGPSMEK